jgi:hypothetical protein
MAFWKTSSSPVTYINLWVLIAVANQMVVLWDDTLCPCGTHCLHFASKVASVMFLNDFGIQLRR